MKIGIIGAGITGLSAAYELTKKGHEVTIFERTNNLGGLSAYIPIGNNYIESFYHHFFQTDTHIISLAKELGIENKLKFYKAKTGVYSHKKIYSFSSPLDLLRFYPLSFFDRFRCGITLGLLKFLPMPLSSLDTISAKSWIKKYAGKSVYREIWGPLLKGKFSQFSSSVPALWLWGRVRDRSLKLGYFDGSAKIMFDGLLKEIKKKKGKIYFGMEIKKIQSIKEKVIVQTQTSIYNFDAVILTTVSPIAKKLIKNSAPEKYSKLMSSIDHLGAVCLIAEVDRPIQSQYWVNLCDTTAPVLVMIEHTNMIPTKDYNGKHIIYLANYMYRTDKRFSMSDKEIFDSYIQILPKLNKNFNKSWIKKYHIAKHPRAQTIFQRNTYDRIPPIQTPIKGIYMVNIDQMYPHDRNLNQGIDLAKKVVSLITDTI